MTEKLAVRGRVTCHGVLLGPHKVRLRRKGREVQAPPLWTRCPGPTEKSNLGGTLFGAPY